MLKKDSRIVVQRAVCTSWSAMESFHAILWQFWWI